MEAGVVPNLHAVVHPQVLTMFGPRCDPTAVNHGLIRFYVAHDVNVRARLWRVVVANLMQLPVYLHVAAARHAESTPITLLVLMHLNIAAVFTFRTIATFDAS